YEYSYTEIMFSPGYFEINLKKGKEVSIIFSDSILKSFKIENKSKILNKFKTKSLLGKILLLRSSDFITEYGIVAGYPWFTSWGRDTFISIPGLLLYPERIEEVRKIFKIASKYIKNGLVPNIFGFKNPSSYNSVDASLFFIWALSKYVEIIGNDGFVKSMKDSTLEIIDNYIKGTDFGIKMDSDGLIYAYSPSKSLTWMDAVFRGKPITQRGGKPVEIQSLWYNALKFVKNMDLLLIE
ncbi:MAG: hypothetical protein DRI36_06575, partial [Caldiserica bacterium]